MKTKFMLTVLVVCGFGCGTSPLVRDMRSAYDPPVVDDGSLQSGADDKPDEPIVGFTAMGEVVVFDGRTGEIKSMVKGGGGAPRDIAMDPWQKGVWEYEENEDGTGGEIRFCALEKEFGAANEGKLPTRLHPCEHSLWIDGNAAMMPTENGLWIFEDGIGGARWKVLRIGEPMPSTTAPRPASIWMEHNEIEVFSFGMQNDRLQLLSGDMGPKGPEVSLEFDWGAPYGYPPTARYAWFTRDAGLLFDAVSNSLIFRPVVNGEIGLPRVIDVGIAVPRIEAAATNGDSALVLGRDMLWIVQTHDSDVELMTGLWLNGEVRQSDLFFSRDLLVLPDRVFVGTDRGIRAIGTEMADGRVVNAFMDEEFVGEGLRGPVDAIRPAAP